MTRPPAPFHTASDDAIRRGDTTDVYFDRTLRILDREGVDPAVVVEVRAKGLPRGWPWAVLTGVEEAASLLAGRGDVTFRSLPEGSPFQAGEPVAVVEGRYRAFAELETPLLGFLCQASGIATAAARCRLAAGERTLLSFGARRMHPAITPMIERAAWIGGCDGVSAIAGARLIGVDATGTMPHALVLTLGDTVRAALAFAAAFGDEGPVIVLIDTFNDEKFEALRVAEALGERLAGVRFDTPGSRRGHLGRILAETRWELDTRGHGHVRFFASGGIDEDAIRELNPVCHGYGVGGHIAAAPPVDFSLDIVELDGRPLAKRGKRSGRKALLACRACSARSVVPAARGTATWPCPRCGASCPDALVSPGDPVPGARAARERLAAAHPRLAVDRPLDPGP